MFSIAAALQRQTQHPRDPGHEPMARHQGARDRGMGRGTGTDPC